MGKIKDISAVLICKNAAKTLRLCLDALEDFEDVTVVLDETSTDESGTICASYSNVTTHQLAFKGFGPMKNLATSLAKNDWIFSMDTDEIASPSLISFLAEETHNPYAVYAFKRNNCYKGKVINACGWDNDYPIRLYHRKFTSFTDAMVHESIKTEGMNVVKREEFITHLAYDEESQLALKAERYSSLYAEQNYRKKEVATWLIPFKTGFTFFKDFVLRRGFLYGATGWMIAGYNARGVRLKYSKLHALNKKISISLIIGTYNRPDALERVLESVVRQSLIPMEVLIADDGSSNATQSVVDSFRDKLPIQHIWHEDEGFRLSAIRNKAILSASGDFIAVIDGDMVLHRDFIKDISQHARKGQYLQGKRVLLSASTTDAVLKRELIDPGPFTKGITNRLNAISVPFLAKWLSPIRNHIKATRGCSMHFWKEDLVKVNGYNEDIKGWGREDSELAVRLQNAGVKRKNMVLSAVAFHLFHPEAKRDQLQLNDEILDKAIQEKAIWCKNGLIQE